MSLRSWNDRYLMILYRIDRNIYLYICYLYLLSSPGLYYCCHDDVTLLWQSKTSDEKDLCLKLMMSWPIPCISLRQPTHDQNILEDVISIFTNNDILLILVPLISLVVLIVSKNCTPEIIVLVDHETSWLVYILVMYY